MESGVNEDEIEKKAMEEILLEAKRAAERARDQGATGWLNPRIASTNKNFLRRTLVSTLRHPYGSRKRGQYNKYRSYSTDHRTAHYDKQSDNVKSSTVVQESAAPLQDSEPSRQEQDPPRQEQDLPRQEQDPPRLSTTTWDSPDHCVSDDSSSGFSEVKEHTPPGGYVYDAYQYSFQAEKDPHNKEKLPKQISNHSQAGDTNEKHRHDGHSDTYHSPQKRHRHSSEKHKHKRRKKDSSDSSDVESNRKKKHKKNKHKSKHKSKHHKKKKSKH